ncbi:MAG: flagellar assembly protein FliW [Naasia sp.]|nr:flagellar assembly protein FliW [Naasia sp.]
MTPTLPDTTMNLTFTAPPPGLAPIVDFALSAVPEAEGLYTLRDTGDAGVRLFLVDPSVYVPDYAPRITDEHLDALGSGPDDLVEAYVVATITDDGPIVNLLAPILVNVTARTAAQVILDDSRWPLRAALVPPTAT